MVRKTEIDWEAIEREYRAGQLSVSEIGRLYGVSHTAINKKAKKFGWTRNLAAKVKEAVKARLVSEGVSASDARETIELAAERDIQVIRSHRTAIRVGRELTLRLMDELSATTSRIGELEEMIEADTANDKTSTRRSAMTRAVSLPSRAGAIRDLSNAAKNWIALERQAFNLDDGRSPADEVSPADGIRSSDPVEAAKEYQRMISGG